MRSGVGGVCGAATGQPPFPRLPRLWIRRRIGHHQLIALRPIQLFLHDDDVTVLPAAVHPAIAATPNAGRARGRGQSLVLAGARRPGLIRSPPQTDRFLYFGNILDVCTRGSHFIFV